MKVKESEFRKWKSYLMAGLMVGFESLHFPTFSVGQIGKQWDSTAASLYPFYINVWWVLFGSIQPSHSMAAATLGLLKHSIFQWWKKCRRCGLQEDNPQSSICVCFQDRHRWCSIHHFENDDRGFLGGWDDEHKCTIWTESAFFRSWRMPEATDL